MHNKSWFNKEKLFDFDNFFNSLRNFEIHLYETYFYKPNTPENRERIKNEFDVLIKDYFGKFNINISIEKVAKIKFIENCIVIIPYKNLAASVFFTDKRKELWNSFINACKLQDIKKLLN